MMHWKKTNDYPRDKKYINLNEIHNLEKVILFCGLEYHFHFSNKKHAANILKHFEKSQVPVRLFEKFSPHILKIETKTPYIKDFLRYLAQTEPGFKELIPEICDYLKISKSLGLDITQLKAMSVSDAIENAIEAQDNGDFELIWTLFNYYYQDSLEIKEPSEYLVNSQTLFDLANSILEKNPHYKEAQTKITEILMRNEEASSPEESYLNLQNKFRFALNGDNQELTDRFFHEMCGGKLGEPIQENIQGDAETLINLANKIKSLNEKLNQTYQQTNYPGRFFTTTTSPKIPEIISNNNSLNKG
ncbi:hypothetical protein [Legionella fairfieldensis]|uniref:hypothetical protein n=1 Tax=Legionella fairfieldensis TaxID=45064 RepID=UPI00048EF637|nr:hypothetical protein [Legionella fairfieldensis]